MLDKDGDYIVIGAIHYTILVPTMLFTPSFTIIGLVFVNLPTISIFLFNFLLIFYCHNLSLSLS